MGRLLQWTYRAWFFCDLFIFSGVLRYGWKQLANQTLRPYYVRICLGIAVAWGIGLYCLHISHLDTPIGATSAYLCQLCISGLYLALFLRQGKTEPFSSAAGWLRTIGTGMNTVFMNIHYPDNYFLRFIANLSTALDIGYLYLFLKARRATAQAAGLPASDAKSELAAARSLVS
jgi:hypothetical protein